ncbi:hypothetical protein D0962_21105 [Leptolyngbyaceae cyanobacterium CCMR0082]|uniref:Uncharacterized protein n=1 Tax=Adonisia turfae CCMR0082 TaxID=2304604 RepID=A0A6M0SAY2_9CYAN|nr:hypothetical protein [Adonisia turfae]MDV3349815.1 hypothetical protein [Leptothoe sp. LEGE 181152]NEZ65243.1 hypothetical protein [Adonisia turfae CCMR0082]
MRTLKLMADYDCFPLWEILDNDLKNIDPSDLPLSNKLRNSLKIWSDKYNATLNYDDPINSGFESEIDEQKFEQEGEALFKFLKKELGREFRIIRS